MRGKLPLMQPTEWAVIRFNEARALCAGNWRDSRGLRSRSRASMRPALYARETRQVGRFQAARRVASMRPALYARETLRGGYVEEVGLRRFNEARALCAGNWRRDRTPPLAGSCFNEARALCAGN